ncbi:MAG: MFS transporter [Chloroflexi bacterium]|nr:MFS transporter [Chloroflexota bacterium]
MSSSLAEHLRLVGRLTVPLYLPTFLLSLGQGILVPTLPLFAHSFGVSFTLVTLAIGVQGFGTLAASVPGGFLLARAGGRRVMIAGTAVVTASSLALPFSGLFPFVILYRLIGGFGVALWMVSRFAYIAEAVPLAQRGRAAALFGGTNRAGMFVGPVIGGVLAEQVGMEVALLSSAAAAGLALVLVMFPGREESYSRRYVQRGSLMAGLLAAVRRKPWEITSASTAQFLIQCIRGGRTTLLPLYGSFVIGLDVDTVGVIVGVSSLIDMVFFLPAGVIMDRFGRKFASVPAFVMLSAGMLFVAFSSDAITLFLAATLMSVGNGFGSGSMMTLGADLSPPEARGEFMGFWRLVGDSGSTGGPLLVGGVADLWGLTTAAVAVAATGALAVLTLGLFVPETLRSHVGSPRGSSP